VAAGRTQRNPLPFISDTQWTVIHTEAIVEADHEPLLRPLIDQNGVDRNASAMRSQ
jgi:hypothetical protein